MGMGASGILYFGWDLGSTEDYDSDNSWSAHVLEAIEESEDSDDAILAIMEYDGEDTYAAKQDALDNLPFTIIDTGHHDYSYYALVLKNTHWNSGSWVRADVTVGILSLFQSETILARAETLYLAARMLKLDPPTQPRLILTSDYG